MFLTQENKIPTFKLLCNVLSVLLENNYTEITSSINWPVRLCKINHSEPEWSLLWILLEAYFPVKQLGLYNKKFNINNNNYNNNYDYNKVAEVTYSEIKAKHKNKSKLTFKLFTQLIFETQSSTYQNTVSNTSDVNLS